MPVLGMTMQEGIVATWLKHEGDSVQEGEPLLTVEMDKGTMDVEAPSAGIVKRILVPAGQTVPVNTPIAEIGAANQARVAPVEAVPSPVANGTIHTHELRATPLARSVARDLSVDLTHVKGSGPRGRIVERDVLVAPHAASAATPTEPSTPLAEPVSPTPLVVVRPVESGHLPTGGVEPLSRFRRLTAERMLASARMIPQLTQFLQVDLSDAARLRDLLANDAARLGISRLPWDVMFAKALGLALVEHPAMNCIWVEGQGLLHHATAHVGIAVALEPEGLVVPVLHDTNMRSLRALTIELQELVARARVGRLRPEDMIGSSCTVTNLGRHRIDGFTPLINPPESAILGVGRIAPSPMVVEGTLQVRTAATLSLTFDHRVVDGRPAAAFLECVADLLEHPWTMLAMG
jgi:pyruvate dehydrogenase E2 component (dihydrolipoamide acetyltransferase)